MEIKREGWSSWGQCGNTAMKSNGLELRGRNVFASLGCMQYDTINGGVVSDVYGPGGWT